MSISPVGNDAYAGNGSGANFESEGSAFQSVRKPNLSPTEVSRLFASDLTHGLIQPTAKIVPYSELIFSETNANNVQQMLSGLTIIDPVSGLVIKKPSLANVWEIILNKTDTQNAGLNLAGIPVLRILEYIVSQPKLKAKIKVIFDYPKSANFLHLKEYVLSMIRKNLLGNFGKYLQLNKEETETHLEDFVKAVEKEHLLKYFKSAVEKDMWDDFFTLVIFNPGE